MIQEQTLNHLREKFFFLKHLSDSLKYELLSSSQEMNLPAKVEIFKPSDACEGFPLILEGIIKVSRAGSNGRSLQLYTIKPGEVCIVTTSCLLGNSLYPAQGTTEEAVKIIFLNKNLFIRLINEHNPFREYIFNLFSDRISSLMLLVEEVAFKKLDQRLAALLLQKGPLIQATHQSLADELGSVREMMSRLLKSFQQEGLIELGRENIRVLDVKKIQEIATRDY